MRVIGPISVPAVVNQNSIADNATIITNFYGMLNGISATKAAVNIGASGDASKACSFSSLTISLAGTVAQSVIVYNNLTPWKLTVSSAWNAGNGFVLTAPNSYMTDITITPKASVTVNTATIDLSGNALTASRINTLLVMLSGLTMRTIPDPVATCDLSGGANANVVLAMSWSALIALATNKWTVGVNRPTSVVVSGSADTDLNGTYAYDAGTYRKDANTVITFGTNETVGFDTFQLAKNGTVVAVATDGNGEVTGAALISQGAGGSTQSAWVAPGDIVTLFTVQVGA